MLLCPCLRAAEISFTPWVINICSRAVSRARWNRARSLLLFHQQLKSLQTALTRGALKHLWFGQVCLFALCAREPGL